VRSTEPTCSECAIISDTHHRIYYHHFWGDSWLKSIYSILSFISPSMPSRESIGLSILHLSRSNLWTTSSTYCIITSMSSYSVSTVLPCSIEPPLSYDDYQYSIDEVKAINMNQWIK